MWGFRKWWLRKCYLFDGGHPVCDLVMKAKASGHTMFGHVISANLSCIISTNHLAGRICCQTDICVLYLSANAWLTHLKLCVQGIMVATNRHHLESQPYMQCSLKCLAGQPSNCIKLSLQAYASTRMYYYKIRYDIFLKHISLYIYKLPLQIYYKSSSTYLNVMTCKRNQDSSSSEI